MRFLLQRDGGSFFTAAILSGAAQPQRCKLSIPDILIFYIFYS